MALRRSLISLVIVSVIAVLGSMTIGAGRAWAGANPCAIGIELVEIPETDTEFEFEVTGDVSGSFTLSDPGNPISTFGINIDVVRTVTELVPPGWELLSIECTEGVTNCGMGVFIPCLTATVDGNSVTFECLDNDEAFCVFTNVRIPGDIPTLSEWGLIAMAGIMGLVGLFIVMRRRKAEA